MGGWGGGGGAPAAGSVCFFPEFRAARVGRDNDPPAASLEIINEYALRESLLLAREDT